MTTGVPPSPCRPYAMLPAQPPHSRRISPIWKDTDSTCTCSGRMCRAKRSGNTMMVSYASEPQISVRGPSMSVLSGSEGRASVPRPGRRRRHRARRAYWPWGCGALLAARGRSRARRTAGAARRGASRRRRSARLPSARRPRRRRSARSRGWRRARRGSCDGRGRSASRIPPRAGSATPRAGIRAAAVRIVMYLSSALR